MPFADVRASLVIAACICTGCGAPPRPSSPGPQSPPPSTSTPPPVTTAPPVQAAPPVTTGTPPRTSPPRDSIPPLPGIPSVTGAPLKLSVIYPTADQLIASRDSNFILGSVGSGDATLTINGYPVDVKANGAYLGWIPIPPGTSPSYRLIARRGSDSVVLDHPVRTFRTPVAASQPRPVVPDPNPIRWVALGAPRGAVAADTDRTISIRPVPSGTYKWFGIQGTVVERTGVENGFTRIRLDSDLVAYVATSDVTELRDPGPSSAPNRIVGNVSVIADSAWSDVVLPLREPPPYLVEEEAGRLVLTLYSTRATTDIISYRTVDPVIRAVTWEPLTSQRVRYVVHLRDEPYGYLVFHDGRNLVLRVRRAPAVNRERPLAGLTIAVDAGHPPIGTTGPTGLYEGDATLAISNALKEELEQRGARVIMTRTTLDALDLAIRPIIARRANAHALISVHLNAVPDGINPIGASGTGTYFFQPHSEPLARTVQTGMVKWMGLRDRGVYYDNLALVRTTWMPAVLCEGAFLIVPEQEAAIRDPAGQRAYARGVAEGVEAYFKSLAR